MNGIDRLFDEMKLRVFVIQASGKEFTPEPEEKEDEFVKLSEYEKLERELEKANERAEHYRLKLYRYFRQDRRTGRKTKGDKEAS